MGNINITQIDNTPLSGLNAVFRDALLTAAGAVTYAKGTILAFNTATKKFIEYKPAGAGDETIPVAILTTESVFAGAGPAGAGDAAIRPQVGGEVRLAKLIIHADGDNSNVDAGVIQALQDYNVTVVDAAQLSAQDNG